MLDLLVADMPDMANLRRPLRQRPALREDPGWDSLVRLAMLLARQAAAEISQELVDARNGNWSSADNRTAVRLDAAAAGAAAADGAAAPRRAT